MALDVDPRYSIARDQRPLRSRPKSAWDYSQSAATMMAAFEEARFLAVPVSRHVPAARGRHAIVHWAAALTWVADHRPRYHSDRKAQTAVSALAELTPNGLGHFLRPMQRIAAEAAQRSILRPRSRKIAASRTSLGVAALRRRSAGSRFSRLAYRAP